MCRATRSKKVEFCSLHFCQVKNLLLVMLMAHYMHTFLQTCKCILFCFFGCFPPSAIPSHSIDIVLVRVIIITAGGGGGSGYVSTQPSFFIFLYHQQCECAVGLQIAYLSVYSHILHWQLVVLLVLPLLLAFPIIDLRV